MNNIPGLSWLLLLILSDMRVIIIIFVALSFKIKWHNKTTITNNKQQTEVIYDLFKYFFSRYTIMCIYKKKYFKYIINHKIESWIIYYTKIVQLIMIKIKRV